MDEHVMEALGKSKVTIKNGKVIKVEASQITYCPLFHKYRGIEKLDKESIEQNMQFRVDDFGMCTPKRELKMADFLSFGISETLGTLLEENIIDCAILVSDGAGTAIITDPELVQGIGGRISGIINTTPIKEIIDVIGDKYVLNTENAEINQSKGVLKAIDLGFKNIAVTLTKPDETIELRHIEKKHPNVKIFIFVVHTTGISDQEAEIFFQNSDVITSCASKSLREIARKNNTFSVGASIPIYGVTNDGIKFLKKRIEKIGGLKEKKDPKIPDPLI